jgi:hypothetical protein
MTQTEAFISLLDQVDKTRKAQMLYYQTRSSTALKTAKTEEEILDLMSKDYRTRIRTQQAPQAKINL